MKIKIVIFILDYFNTLEKGANSPCIVAKSTRGKKSTVGMKV